MTEQYIGIDVGSKELVLYELPSQVHHTINLQDEEWWNNLGLIVRPGALVAVEPTGRHYSAPIIATLQHFGAYIYSVDHATTRHYRQMFISVHKDDYLDAQALAEAIVHHEHKRLRGVQFIDGSAFVLTTALRSTIQAYRRAAKGVSRHKNRLHQLAHHVWPQLAGSGIDQYAKAVRLGFVSPEDLHLLDHRLRIIAEEGGSYPAGFTHGNSRNAFHRLAAKIPPWRQLPVHFETLIPHTLQLLDEEDRRKDELEAILIDIISHPVLQPTTAMLQTIPSAGTYWIATIHAATHCRTDTMTGDGLKAVVGFYPQREASGTKNRSFQHARGYKPARGAVHLWTTNLLHPNSRPNPIAAYFDRKKAAGDKYAFAAARSKLLRVISGVAISGKPCNWPSRSQLERLATEDPLKESKAPKPPPNQGEWELQYLEQWESWASDPNTELEHADIDDLMYVRFLADKHLKVDISNMLHFVELPSKPEVFEEADNAPDQIPF